MKSHWIRHASSIISLLFCCAVISAEQLYTVQPPVTPELAFSGSYGVGVSTITATDPSRLNTANFITRHSRDLVLEVWYPTDLAEQLARNRPAATYKNVTRLQKPFELEGIAYRDAPVLGAGLFPLVILSHGFTGYRTQMFYLGEHLASHGYVVVGIDHTDSTNAEVFDDATRASGITSTLYNRARDQQFILDYFSDQATLVQKVVDTDNAAIIGHSMGGFGALNTVGGCYAIRAEQLREIGFPAAIAALLPWRLNSCFGGREQLDPRWKAVQAIAPWGGEFDVHDIKAMANIRVPTFYIAGDQDNTSGFKNGVKKLHERTGSKYNYMMVYKNARHNIAGHPAPAASFATDYELGHYVDPSWDIETINRINKHMTLAFLDCHLKNDPARCVYLPKREDIQQYKGENGLFIDPWPGFTHLWGSGVLFFRK